MYVCMSMLIIISGSSANHLLVTTATEITSEESNYLRLLFLILKISARAVRLTFDQEFHPGHLCDTLDRSRTSLKGLQKKHIINKHQMRLLFPPTGMLTFFNKKPIKQTFVKNRALINSSKSFVKICL